MFWEALDGIYIKLTSFQSLTTSKSKSMWMTQ
jgi:hypothetical protein